MQGDTDSALWDSKHHGEYTVIKIAVVPDAETLVTVAEDGSMCFWGPN